MKNTLFNGILWLLLGLSIYFNVVHYVGSDNIVATSTTDAVTQQSEELAVDSTDIEELPDHEVITEPAAAIGENCLWITADKMNVLYIGPDNPVTVSVQGFASDKIKPSIRGGGGRMRPDSINPGGYIVNVSKTGKATISVDVEMKSGQTKSMGAKEFRIKRVPPPVASFMGLEGEGALSAGKFKVAQGLLAKMKNFDFEMNFKVTSFDMSFNVGGLFVTERSANNRLTPNMKKYLAKAKKGQRILITNVKAKSSKTSNEKIPGIMLKVK